jgi:DNA-directed RNA polymerase specialized sigma24 family protein
MIVRSGRKIPGRAGLWPGPAAPVETADADRALTELYQLHYRPLVKMAALLVPDLATAEDIVQDAFAAVYSAWPGCRDRPDAGAALSLLLRLVVDRSRAVPPGRRPADSGLVSALWALPARQREILVLQYVGDLPENQVAAVAGISEAAVRSQVALAFSALRAELPSVG